MQNLHDDNHLDELSRQAAEEFAPDHELHSWDKLRPQLDAALPEKKERKRRFLFWLFLFLLVGGGGITYSIVKNGGAERVSQKENVHNNIDNTVVPPAAPSSNKVTDPATIDTKTAQKITTTVTEPVIKTEHSSVRIAQTKLSTKKTGVVKSYDQQKTTKQPNITEESKTDQSKQEEVTQEEPKQQEPKKEEPKTVQPKTEQPKIELAKTEEPKAEQPKKEQPKTEQPAPTATAKKENQKTPSVSNNRWEFGLAFAPDVSTVRFTHSQDPGSNIGLTIGYNLSKRFQIQTGVFYTSKNYKSYGKDYHPPKGYWTDYVKLETVTAECDMWDVPLNVRYNFVPRQSSNFFATAGLSSYFMKKEDYDFFYYYNGNPVNRFRSYYTDNKHWFSVMNLSVGYERQVGKHVSLQAEPFFKQPLKGVGFGKVRLNSTGIYFSVKYKLQSAKK